MSKGLLLVAAVLLLAAGGVLVAAGLRSNRHTVSRRIRRMLTEQHPDLDQPRPTLALLWVQLSRRAEAIGKGSAFFDRLETLLDRAGWLLRPGEFALLLCAVAVGGLFLASLLTGSIVLSLLFGFLAPGVVYLRLLRRASRIQDRGDAQLPEVLDQLSASLRAGHGLNQAIAGTAHTMPAPLGPELARVVSETEMGRSLEEALEGMAERVGSHDLRWTVRAMVIQARTGGRLSEILEVLADFMRDREEVRREVKALTADGRASALVLSALPFFVSGLILAVRPEYLTPMFHSPAGRAMLLAAGVMLLVGIVTIRKMVHVEV